MTEISVECGKKLQDSQPQPHILTYGVKENLGARNVYTMIRHLRNQNRRRWERRNGFGGWPETQLPLRQQWWLRISPADHNENYQLKLPGAWEPLCSHSPHSHCESSSAQGFVSYGDKKISDKDEENNK